MRLPEMENKIPNSKPPDIVARCFKCGGLQTLTPTGEMACLNIGCSEATHIFPINDPVNHPSHYTSHPSGIECIEVTRHMNFNIGNAVKYLWRAGLKTDYTDRHMVPTDKTIEDLKKAVWYINDQIALIEGKHSHENSISSPSDQWRRGRERT